MMQAMNNPASLDDYRQRLRQSLDATRNAVYGQGPDTGSGQTIDQAAGRGPQPPVVSATPSAGAGIGMDQPAPEQMQMRGQQPMSIDQVAGRGTPQPKPQKQPTPPPVEFNKSKLADAKTIGEHVDAMKPDSANRYMNWWEKQYGNINASHDHMLEQLGEKPDENRPMSRKEKFAALMDFGINLIKSSQGRANDPTGALSTAVGATVEGLGDKRKQEGMEWAQKAGAIQGSRAEQLKGIGDYGKAAEGQARINNQDVQAQEARARIAKANKPSFEIGNSDQGIYRANLDTGETSMLGIDGKPLTNLQSGSRGGNETTYRQQHTDLVNSFMSQGKSRAEAMNLATEKMNERGQKTEKTPRQNAEARVNDAIKNSDEWKTKSVDDRRTKRKELLNDERKQAIREAYGIDLDEKRYRSLGSMVGQKGHERAAPPEDEADLRSKPDLARQFYDHYGYLPDDFWPE